LILELTLFCGIGKAWNSSIGKEGIKHSLIYMEWFSQMIFTLGIRIYPSGLQILHPLLPKT